MTIGVSAQKHTYMQANTHIRRQTHTQTYKHTHTDTQNDQQSKDLYYLTWRNYQSLKLSPYWGWGEVEPSTFRLVQRFHQHTHTPTCARPFSSTPPPMKGAAKSTWIAEDPTLSIAPSSRTTSAHSAVSDFTKSAITGSKFGLATWERKKIQKD
jgi:hypothetical protein